MLLITQGQLITPWGPGSNDCFHQSVEMAMNLAFLNERTYYVCSYLPGMFVVAYYDGCFLQVPAQPLVSAHLSERDVRAVVLHDGRVNAVTPGSGLVVLYPGIPYIS